VIAGAAVLAAAVVAFLISVGGGAAGPQPSSSAIGPSTAPPTPSADDAVDPGVVDMGWVPEPITRDPEEYARAALEAAGTFDTRLATRVEWVSWLETWFTPSPLYENAQDALDQMDRYQVELDQAVVQPQTSWDDLAREDGRVTAHVSGNVAYLELPETTANRMWTATADLVLTYTRSAAGGEVTYDETVRVSVQVVCDGVSVPTPDSAQQAGDCKVVRYFDQAVG
jgi:hypothetical protein